MNKNRLYWKSARAKSHPSAGFTLIELLVVIAIISLLIGILLPSLAGAREQAKKASTRNTIQAITAGLELFRVENESEFHGYPPSAVAEDETEEGKQDIFGAQWLIRYLMGKDLNGYIPRRAVPSSFNPDSPEGWKQKGWYISEDDETPSQFDRLGPYVEPDNVKVVKTKDLPGDPGGPATGNVPEKTLEQLVILDAFDYPILYYRADPRQARQPNAWLAAYRQDDTYASGEQGVERRAIYTFEDNWLFTGMSKGEEDNSGGFSEADYRGWNFTSGNWAHKIKYFGPEPPSYDVITDNRDSFCYYILDKDTFEATRKVDGSEIKKATVNPYRRDSFLLISAGKDGLYGTDDDVNNF